MSSTRETPRPPLTTAGDIAAEMMRIEYELRNLGLGSQADALRRAREALKGWALT